MGNFIMPAGSEDSGGSGGSGLSALGPLGSLAEGALGAYEDYKNRKINEENLQLQKDTLQYQKEVQQQTWNREDNATQRRVADLRKAGLSPILAAGSAAGVSAPIHVDTPQKSSVKYTTPLDKSGVALALMRAKQDVSRTYAENELIKTQIVRQNLENKMLEHDYNIAKTSPFASRVSGGIVPQIINSLSSKIADFIENVYPKKYPDNAQTRAPYSVDKAKKIRSK